MENGRVRPVLILSFLAVILSGCCTSGFAVPAQDIKGQEASALANSGTSSSAVVYPCDFQGIVRDAATGAPIKGASVTFVKEDKSKSWTAITSDSGRYRGSFPRAGTATSPPIPITSWPPAPPGRGEGTLHQEGSGAQVALSGRSPSPARSPGR